MLPEKSDAGKGLGRIIHLSPTTSLQENAPYSLDYLSELSDLKSSSPYVGLHINYPSSALSNGKVSIGHRLISTVDDWGLGTDHSVSSSRIRPGQNAARNYGPSNTKYIPTELSLFKGTKSETGCCSAGRVPPVLRGPRLKHVVTLGGSVRYILPVPDGRRVTRGRSISLKNFMVSYRKTHIGTKSVPLVFPSKLLGIRLIRSSKQSTHSLFNKYRKHCTSAYILESLWSCSYLKTSLVDSSLTLDF